MMQQLNFTRHIINILPQYNFFVNYPVYIFQKMLLKGHNEIYNLSFKILFRTQKMTDLFL